MSAEESHPLVCDFCQSPLSSNWWRRSETASVPDTLYCCLGCRMAASIMQDRSEAGAARGLLTRLGLSIFCTMNVMAFTMALWTTDVYGASEPSSRLLVGFQGLFRYVVLLFSLPVLGLLGIPLFSATWQSVRQGLVLTDVLLSLGVGAAFASSFLAVLKGDGNVYFEVGCVILVMTSLGRWLEVEGRLKANEALDALASLLPATVRRVGSLEEEELVPLDQVNTGDVLRVLPGERFPADGSVAANSALVDEQVLTGESRPILKEPGRRFWAARSTWMATC